MVMKFSVESLPMRNWNEKNAMSMKEAVQRWEPTYEELKLSFCLYFITYIFLLRAYLWGIETPDVNMCVDDPVLCWEPTYEELKHWTPSTFISSFWSWEPTYEELKLFNVFLQKPISISLRAYLWGIETLMSMSCGEILFGWEPTYEELKHVCRPLGQCQ